MIDWKAIFDTALDAGVATAKTGAPQIKAALKEARTYHEDAIREIGTAFVEGAIDRATFESSMEDEAITLRNELLAVTVLSKAIVQKAVNAFRDALVDGIEHAVSAVI